VKNYLVDNGFLSQDISDSIMIVKSNVHADVSLVNSSDELDIEAFKNWRIEFKSAEFILEEGIYKVGREVEKNV